MRVKSRIERLAEELLRRFPEPRKDRLSATILSSLDDPVVGATGVGTLKNALDKVPAIGVFTPARGGHIALSVVSPVVTRAFVQAVFSFPTPHRQSRP